MSVIEDTRKVMQDFLAPELRGISARLDALEKRLDGVDTSLNKKIDSVERNLDKKIDDVDRRAEQRHDAVMMALTRLMDYNELRDRRVRLESKDAAHQQ